MPRIYFPPILRLLAIFVTFMCAAVSVQAQGGRATTSFQTTPEYPAGIGVSGIAVADFNGDGNMDAATINRSSNDVSILLGRGAEGFALPVSYPSGSAPAAIKAGDLNHDGKIDLLVINSGSQNISVLIGDGTGKFSVSSSLTLPKDTYTLVLGDFNGDGNVDGMAGGSGYGIQKLTFLRGDGFGGFSAINPNIPIDNYIYGIAAGDFNKDGKLDLATANSLNGVAILLGDGAGGFSAPTTVTTGGIPYNVTVADLNGDNNLDLAVTCDSVYPAPENLMVLLGTGTGSFGTPKGYVVNTSPRDVTAGDFNGDSKQDIAVTSSWTGSVSVLLGDGTGQLSAARSYGAGSRPSSLATGDFNKDGKLDIVAGNGQAFIDLSSGLALLLGDGTGDFLAARTKQVGASPGPMVTNDFNNDGKLDVAVLNINGINSVSYSASILLGDGAGNFTESQRIPFGPNDRIHSIATGDFNKDGKADLAITVYGAAGISILLGDGAGHFPTDGYAGTYPAITRIDQSYIYGVSYVKVADFNNDGNQDLVVTGRNGGGFVIMLGNGDGTFRFVSGLYFNSAYDVAVGDFNKDGKADIALVSDKIYMLAGDGAGRFSNTLSDARTLPFPAALLAPISGDFNKDGRLDLAVTSNNLEKGYLTIYLTNAGNGFSYDAPKTYDAGYYPSAVTLADFNNDGNADLATSNTSSYNVSVFAGDGAGNFLPGIPFDLGVPLESISSGDFNSDQKVDLFATSGWTNSVHLLLNNYTGPQLTLSVDDVSVVEADAGTSNAVFTVRLSESSTEVVKVNYVFEVLVFGVPSNYARNGEDFQGTNGTLTFAPGVTTQTITIPVKGDTTDEFDEIFNLNLSNPINAVLYKSKGTATITDNDAPPTISISDAGSVAEGNSSPDKTVTMTVSLSQPSGKEITVDVKALDGTTNGVLDVFGSSTTLTFPAGASSRDITLTIRGENLYESDEIYFENLSNPVNATIADGQGQLIIINDDPLPSLVISDVAAFEGASGFQSVSFAVSLSNPSYQTVSINYSTVDGTATAGIDYTASSGVVTFNPGETSRKIFSVPVIDDKLDEIDESFYLNLNVTNGVAPAVPVKGTIIDDDGPELSINDLSITEGNSGTTAANFTVKLSAASPQDITVRFSTMNGTATANSDYQFAFNQLLTIPAGTSSATISIQVRGDTAVEPDETFAVGLLNPTRATLADAQATGTIVNDDSAIQFSASAYSIREDATNSAQGYATLTIDVARSGDTSTAAAVRYLTSDMSGGNECDQVTTLASQRCDYATAAGTLRFAAGESSKQIQIPVVNDGYIEGNETFLIKLESPAGATLGAINEATITIEDRGVVTTPAENPYLGVNFFVRQNYLDFLGREPDTEGFGTWTGALNNCGPEKGFLGSPLNCDRAFVAHGFIASKEFTDRGYRIYRMYEVGLLRLPRYAEFVPDMAAVSGAPDSQELEQNTTQFAESFTARAEFTGKYADVSAPSQAALFIARLEQNAGVTLPEATTTLPGQPPQYNRQDLINLRANGTLTLGQTLRAFVEQKVIYDRFFERGFVTMQYFGFLRRDPDLNDPNLLGWTEWVFVFTNGGAARNRPDILARDIHHLTFGFIYSEEYRKRFGKP